MKTHTQLFEMLETRRLMSATPTARVTGDHVLVVEGTDAAEQFFVNETAPGTVAVGVLNADGTSILLNQTFTGVQAVKVLAKGGDDQVVWTGKTISAVIDGGDGNDTIFSSDQGCAGSYVIGGNGVDNLQVDNSTQVFDPVTNLTTYVAGKAVTTVDGGAGNDNILIDHGSTAFVFAGSGNDVITVNGIDPTHEAHAFVDGGAGIDSLIATDADVLYIRIENAAVVDTL